MADKIKFCPQCGQKYSEGAKFCSKCGYNFDLIEDNQATSDTADTQAASDTSEQPETASRAGEQGKKPRNIHKVIAVVIASVVLAVLAIGIASNLVYQSKERAHQQYLESSESRVRESKRAKESKQESLETSLADDAKTIVTNMVQDDQNIDAKCTDVTITSHDYGNQYSGYAELEDDDGDSTTVDITVTDVKYDGSTSVQMDSDQVDKIADEFYTYD